MYRKMKVKVKIFSVLLLAAITLILLSLAFAPGLRRRRPRNRRNKTLLQLSPAKKRWPHLACQILSRPQAGRLIWQSSNNRCCIGGFGQYGHLYHYHHQYGSPFHPRCFTTISLHKCKMWRTCVSTNAISDGQAKPWWLLLDPIPDGGTVAVTVTGVLTSASDVTIENTAIITAFNSTGESDPADNQSSVNVSIVGNNPFQMTYLPVIFKNPQPEYVIVYSDDFSDSDSGWYEGYSDSDHCYSYYNSGRYRVNLDSSDRDCWRPAPSAAERTYGSFEVAAYLSEGSGNIAYGIYSNGQGGDYYYLFRVWPNNSCSSGGDWELYRRSSLVSNGSCNSAINRGSSSSATNILKITHTSDGNISVYANNTLLGTYADSSQLTGAGAGLFARSDNQRHRG